MDKIKLFLAITQKPQYSIFFKKFLARKKNGKRREIWNLEKNGIVWKIWVFPKK